MAENAPTSKIAVERAIELLTWFKWQFVEKEDRDFCCVKVSKHKPNAKTHTHPVDFVFYYLDPYLNKRIFLNTDFKSYSKKSISTQMIRDGLRSLGVTIDCAKVSPEWKERYVLDKGSYEIRGFLFVYNHDAEYDKSFYDIISPPVVLSGGRNKRAQGVSLDSLPISEGQYIHIADPALIRYMETIKADVEKLHYDGSFPSENYSFMYPELHFHRTHFDPSSRPATIELISGPYLVIEHGEVCKYNEKTQKVEVKHEKGYVIYYNKPGDSYKEFVYLLDSLANYQIIDRKKEKIRLRVAHSNPHSDIRSNFKRAVQVYLQEWNFDEYKENRLDSISFEVLPSNKAAFSTDEAGWIHESK